ncbi:hypothetical protein D3C86_1722520 [compost metagenome]
MPIATIIITPTNAAIGIFSIKGAPTRMMMSIVMEAIIPASLAREPALIFTRVCATMAQPPMPPKKPLVTLAAPCAIASLLALPFVPVISSTIDKVSNDSIRPTPAITREKGKMIFRVSSENGTSGI